MIAMQDKSLRENKDLRKEDEEYEEDFTSETMIDNQFREFHRALTEALNARVDHLDQKDYVKQMPYGDEKTLG